MRTSTAAFAVLRRRREGRTEWLAQWNPRWHAYNLVGGHQRPDETFRQCLVREVGEELGLQADTDCRVAPEPLAHLEYTAWSASAGAETAYTMELFAVELLTPRAEERVADAAANRWLSEGEIRAGRGADGRPVSPTCACCWSGLACSPRRPDRVTFPLPFLCYPRSAFMTAPAKTGHDAFLSHASADKPWASTLCDGLAAWGCASTWTSASWSWRTTGRRS